MVTSLEVLQIVFGGLGVAVVGGGWGLIALVGQFLGGSPRAEAIFRRGFGTGVTVLGLAGGTAGVLGVRGHADLVPWLFGIAAVGGLVAASAALYALAIELESR